MKGWKRITLVSAILIGGTVYFAYWSLNQFDKVFDTVSASYVAHTLTASTSPGISNAPAASTDR